MTIKSLLLGSAAALVAVSGARAADAIVAEPEPVEYVRVCDAYGAGFFYIPGTETCLRISGEVRVQAGSSANNAQANALTAWTSPVWGLAGTPAGSTSVNGATPRTNLHTDVGALAVYPASPLAPTAAALGTAYNAMFAAGQQRPAGSAVVIPWVSTNTGINAYARGRVNFDARSDTEWGTLQSYIRMQGISTSTTVDGAVLVDQAYISLGGFLIGYTESAWNTFGSWSAGYTDGGGSYGYNQRVLASYTFSGNGFSAILSLEDDNNGNYVPDIVMGAAYSGGWGVIWAKAAWDSATQVRTGAATWANTGASTWHLQAGLELKVPNSPGSAFKIIGFWSQRGWVGVGTTPVTGFNSPYNAAHGSGLLASQWSVLASYQHQFSSQFTAQGVVQYSRGFSLASGMGVGSTSWLFQGDLIWTPITNFQVRAELTHERVTIPGIAGAATATSGWLRFTRSF